MEYPFIFPILVLVVAVGVAAGIWYWKNKAVNPPAAPEAVVKTIEE